MKTEFIQYSEALALKELGFNEPCFGYYHDKIHYKGEYKEDLHFYSIQL